MRLSPRRDLRSLLDTARAHALWARCRLAAAFPRRRRAARRHLLVLAWWFPPFVTGGTYRPLALVQSAVRHGWDVSVLAGPCPRRPTAAGLYLQRKLPSAARLIRVPHPDLSPGRRLFPSVDGGFLTALATARAAVAAFREDPPAVVLATGPPFHNFVAAYYLARIHGSRLILDYRDEWTECPFPFVQQGSADRAWERRCLASADAVLFTTDAQLAHQARAFPGLDPRKCQVIPNGWDPDDFLPAAVDASPPEPPAVLLSFVGRLAEHTPPGSFLAAVATTLARAPELSRGFRVRFVGDTSEAALATIAAFQGRVPLESHGHVPKPEATRVMRESTALLLLNPPALARYLPGKLYDYLAAGRPILVYGAGGEVETLVRRFAAGLIVPEDDPAALLEAVSRLSRGAVALPDQSRLPPWLATRRREVLADATLALAERLTQVPGSP
jgi:glycosyltransferase involved in cell wall biosynthesis